MQYVCNVMEYCHVLYAYRYSDLACGMLLSSNKYKKRPACLSKSIESSVHTRDARARLYTATYFNSASHARLRKPRGRTL